MRLNKFIAGATGMSRRAADQAVAEGRVLVNGTAPGPGDDISSADTVQLDGSALTLTEEKITILLNKPVGYVCSRNGQGSKTIYELLPPELHHLKPVGRLDKDSSGLLLLTNDGYLAHELTHPSKQKTKVYEVALDKPLAPLHQQMISDYGVTLEDGVSQLSLQKLESPKLTPDSYFLVTMHEGRNRQIRRTFASLGYTVTNLHRTQFGSHDIGSLKPGHYSMADSSAEVVL